MNVLEKIHGGYVHNRRVRVLIQKLSALLPDRGRILDVGCGDGLLASLLQQNKPNTSVMGIDVMVRRATHIPVEQFDGRSIPFADASFDAVIFVDVLHHTDAPMILLREAARVAREAVVIKDHTKNGIAADATLRFMDRIGNRRYNVPLPHNYWSRQRWLDAFEELNLRMDIWTSDLGLYPFPLDCFFGRSLHFISRLTLRDHAKAGPAARPLVRSVPTVRSDRALSPSLW